MTSAREQALAAADRKYPGTPANDALMRRIGANAASDVWEPLVLDLLRSLRDVASWASPPVTVVQAAEEVMRRARSATSPTGEADD
jgi:hypothetical protein